MLKKATIAARRAFAYWRMRSLEINLAGILETLPQVRDVETREHMAVLVKRMRRELCAARGDYISFMPPGKRITWAWA